MHDAHSAASTAPGGLDDDRVTDVARQAQVLVRIFGYRTVGARHAGHPSGYHRTDGGNLVPHQADSRCWWADEDKAARFHSLRKIRVLGQEAVTGMHSDGDRKSG